MKKQAFFRFWLIVCIIALTISFASCDETVAPAETTAEILETAEITNVPETTIIPETTSAPETTKAPETTSAPETTKAPETTSVPETTKVPETTSAPETTNAPETTEAPHVHAWSSWVTVLKATCTAEGKQERNCSCGEKETESISALGHTEVIDKAVAATCTKNGKSEGKHCSVCKVVLVAQKVVEATGHIYGEWTVTTPATCTIKGREERTCSCGKKEYQSINALGHTESDWIIDREATCKTAGSQHIECLTCQKKIKTQSIAKNNNHTEVIDKAVAATCTTQGKTEGKHCSVCKVVLVAQEVVKTTDHVYGEWTVTTPATCTIKGRQERVCSNCSRKENQTIAALGHTESEWIIDKEPTCQSSGSQHTVCTVCNKTTTKTLEKLSGEHTYEGGFCSSCGKISPDFSFPSGYITTKPVEIETEYCILKIDENVYVVDGVAEKVDIVCRALEEVTGLKFKNDTYGKDKVVINVTHGEKPWGISGEAERPFDDFTKDLTREITLCPINLFISNSHPLVHELAHALHFSQTKWRPNKFFIEGYATYVTHLTMQYLAANHTYIQYSLSTTDYAIMANRIYTDELYKESIEYWFEHPFTHTPHYHPGDEYYNIGFRIMWYLHDSYGDYQNWIFFRESTNPSSNNQHIDISDEELFAELEQIYGENILNNFYNWLKANEENFEWDLSSKTPSDLTGIQYITVYPNFEYPNFFFETGTITYDNLYINIEEARKYLTEYKNKNASYLSFNGSAKISYYDKSGKLLDATQLQAADEISYIKLNGRGTVINLEIHGVADYEENGLGFKMDNQSSKEGWSSHYDLYYIYDCADSHLIIPSLIDGIQVKCIRNHYYYELSHITEITVSEGIEEIYSSVFNDLKKVIKINLPSSLKTIKNQLRMANGVEIYYAGTKSDWNAIQKADNWDSRLNAYTIHCTDGDITKGS